ncbi:hypothetical protein SERLA73DRAFT_163111 [Serpula lacrymans var. lacrymans S7.3]|uniref:Terpene synthase n=1 Tax=Serpula lacrymans var. lacrymans (strain S7.3) TaxID=936435 RepID=F8QBK6_SERL3|nr:hypothetical protein SERLA73DRAFT_163111 [Serpula lacrymans var. lacrymans S7.3]
MATLLIFDEYSDREDEKGKPNEAPTSRRANYSEIVWQFRERATRGANPRYQQRFIDTFQEYTDTVIQQAGDRQSNHLRTVDEYFAVRRGTSGVKSSLALILFDSDFDISPDQVLDHLVVLELEICATDSIITVNDIISYNRQQARGDDTHNLVTIIMHQYRMGLRDALQFYTFMKA